MESFGGGNAAWTSGHLIIELWLHLENVIVVHRSIWTATAIIAARPGQAGSDFGRPLVHLHAGMRVQQTRDTLGDIRNLPNLESSRSTPIPACESNDSPGTRQSLLDDRRALCGVQRVQLSGLHFLFLSTLQAKEIEAKYKAIGAGLAMRLVLR